MLLGEEGTQNRIRGMGVTLSVDRRADLHVCSWVHWVTVNRQIYSLLT